MKIGIAGHGTVGKAMKRIFPESNVYDKNQEDYNNIDKLNERDCIFICVSTPEGAGGSCDTSAVEEIISKVNADIIIIRSTVYVGFTDAMVSKYNKSIVFQPEYLGETVDHRYSNLMNRKWLAFGGEQSSIDKAIKVYQQVYRSDIDIYQYPAKIVEMAKYMENAHLAMKVTFCNEMYDIATALGVNYNQVREVWLADERIGSSHTFVYPENRGYGGSCLPKDVSSIISQADAANAEPYFLKAMVEKNKKYKNYNTSK